MSKNTDAKRPYGIIYCAENIVNGKKYIGQTTKTLRERKAGHIYGSNKIGGYYFHKAIKKYGKENFIWTIICSADNKETLDELEVKYISAYNTTLIGYNMKEGGSNGSLSEITKEKIRVKATGKKHSEHTKNKMRLIKINNPPRPMAGKKHSAETIKKIKDNLPCRCGYKNSFYNKKHSDESRLKQSLSHRGKVGSENQKNKVSRQYIVETPYGYSVVIKNLKQYCKDNSIVYEVLQKTSSGNHYTRAGWRATRWLPNVV